MVGMGGGWRKGRQLASRVKARSNPGLGVGFGTNSAVVLGLRPLLPLPCYPVQLLGKRGEGGEGLVGVVWEGQ